jgi:hypothetical protein
MLFSLFSSPLFAIETYSLPSGEWRLISLPANPGINSTVEQLFGDDIVGEYKTDWLIYSYDAQLKSYVGKALSDSLVVGAGYWILQVTGETVELDMPSGSTAAMVAPIFAPAEGDDNQWNLAGYPLAVSKKFSELIIKTASGVCAEQRCDSDLAFQENIFLNEVWRPYREGGVTYEKITAKSTLKPWDGFWCATLANARTVGPVELTIDALPLPPISGDWTLTFSEDFEGDFLDPEKWRLGEHFLGINGKAGNSPKHTIVRNGSLELIAEKTPIIYAGKQYGYATGEVTTYKKFRQTYGYFESRIKYDPVQGVWPAFWTMPDRGNYGNKDLRKESFMRFDLGHLNEPISHALLKVKPLAIQNPEARSNVIIYKLLSNEWGEQTITWKNKPAYNPAWLRQVSGNEDINEIVVGQEIIVDVTDYINAQIGDGRQAGFALADNFGKLNGLTFGSRESANEGDRPKLEIDGVDIFPSADAYVAGGVHADKNFGDEAVLEVKDSWGRTSSIDKGGMEFDIMESLGIWGDSVSQNAIHWDYYGIGHPNDHSGKVTVTSTVDRYHTYGMYWEPGKLEFYIDGNKSWEYDNPRAGSVASYILLSHQLGGWSGNDIILDDLFPATMMVDYVYVWSGSKSQ